MQTKGKSCHICHSIDFSNNYLYPSEIKPDGSITCYRCIKRQEREAREKFYIKNLTTIDAETQALHNPEEETLRMKNKQSCKLFRCVVCWRHIFAEDSIVSFEAGYAHKLCVEIRPLTRNRVRCKLCKKQFKTKTGLAIHQVRCLSLRNVGLDVVERSQQKMSEDLRVLDESADYGILGDVARDNRNKLKQKGAVV